MIAVVIIAVIVILMSFSIVVMIFMTLGIVVMAVMIAMFGLASGVGRAGLVSAPGQRQRCGGERDEEQLGQIGHVSSPWC